MVLAAWAVAQQGGATPRSIAGTWETVSGDRIDGIFLMTSSRRDDPNWTWSIQIRVYHRRAGDEQGGWFVTRAGGGAGFLDDRLQIPEVGLDVSFQSDRWNGTWRIDGEDRTVTLARPRPAAGANVHPLCGEWDGAFDARTGTSGSIDVAQSADGVLTAWMHLDSYERYDEPPVSQRYGERLSIAARPLPSVLLPLEMARGSGYRFDGTLSNDGLRLDGVWRAGNDDPARHTLSAPRTFRRIRACM